MPINTIAQKLSSLLPHQGERRWTGSFGSLLVTRQESPFMTLSALVRTAKGEGWVTVEVNRDGAFPLAHRNADLVMSALEALPA